MDGVDEKEMIGRGSAGGASNTGDTTGSDAAEVLLDSTNNMQSIEPIQPETENRAQSNIAPSESEIYLHSTEKAFEDEKDDEDEPAVAYENRWTNTIQSGIETLWRQVAGSEFLGAEYFGPNPLIVEVESDGDDEPAMGYTNSFRTFVYNGRESLWREVRRDEDVAGGKYPNIEGESRDQDHDGSAPNKGTDSSSQVTQRPFKRCTMCYEERTISDTTWAEHDGYGYSCKDTCTSCWQASLTHQIESRSPNNITCPQCGVELAEPMIKELATREDYARYLEKAFRVWQDSNTEWRGCTVGTCKGGYLLDSEYGSIFTCRVCTTQYCTSCEVLMHKGQTCKEYQEVLRVESQEEPSEKEISQACMKRSTKFCPRCKRRMDKESGCDHMTCLCGHEFCWQCLAPYDGPGGIHVNGSLAHEETCEHYNLDQLPYELDIDQDGQLVDEEPQNDEDGIPW